MNDELRKIKRHNRIILIILAILMILFGVSLFQTITRPGTATVTNNYQGQDGRDGIVDYSLINGYIDSRIGNIPIARDGVDGRDGTDGKDGRNGADASPCTVKPVEKGAQVTCPDGSAAVVKDGAEGPQGRPGRTVFVRENPETHEQECRYAGDDVWQPIEECS